MSQKYVYFFAQNEAEGHKGMKDLLGGKGANLAEMGGIGIPVPPGFTISTEVCNLFLEAGKTFPEDVREEILSHLGRLEESAGQKFGDQSNPLLVSVRSGAKFSMPGMMDTILNLGLNDETVEGLAQKSGDRRFALDCYRRLIQMFGDVVLRIPHKKFDVIFKEKKQEHNITHDFQIPEEILEQIVSEYKDVVKEETGAPFPQDVMDQLFKSVSAVFSSWDNPRAVTYRRLNHIPDDLGTAVNVQLMVFGNFGDTSGTGVGFTRNPATGEKELYGEYLINAQGEDVVAGIRTPSPIQELKDQMEEVFHQLQEITTKLENHYHDVQDFEFTIQEKKLYMLQTRNGKRTGLAAVRIAVDMVEEKIAGKEEALQQVEPGALDQLLHPVFDMEEKAKHEVVAQGLSASPGAASGLAVFTADDAVEWKEQGKKIILVRDETSPDDIHGMSASQGILTATGGMTSHAAIVGRQMGKPAVVGCGGIAINEEGKFFKAGDKMIREGDPISIDGATGELLEGELATQPSEVIQVIRGELKPEDSQIYQYFSKLLSWADDVRRLNVRANADTPEDAETAVAFGAEGIGLARTEHMFFERERLPIIKEMILSENEEDRRRHLNQLLPFQRKDFYELFKAMKGYPVTIRTLDPPLHEFLPKKEDLMVKLAELKASGETGSPKVKEMEKLLDRVVALSEFNPMLGHRGCRLGVTFPEIIEMQATAIFEAACQLAEEGGKVFPEIMVPLIGGVNELEDQKKIIVGVAEKLIQSHGVDLDYTVGTMIEIPRAAITADQVAREADFFSFGTNDLTQTTFGISRDDGAAFINHYLTHGIWKDDPFMTVDIEGVGELMEWAVKKGRGIKPDLKVGICGVHGGDPRSIVFCDDLELNYVSCSAYQVPIARLTAAQATLAKKKSR
ncbi:MAG: pyruvate, phosphate dikinase [Candidatus Aminicenantes bacterium]